jgi:hypothetical protein
MARGKLWSALLKCNNSWRSSTWTHVFRYTVEQLIIQNDHLNMNDKFTAPKCIHLTWNVPHILTTLAICTGANQGVVNWAAYTGSNSFQVGRSVGLCWSYRGNCIYYIRRSQFISDGDGEMSSMTQLTSCITHTSKILSDLTRTLPERIKCLQQKSTCYSPNSRSNIRCPPMYCS